MESLLSWMTFFLPQRQSFLRQTDDKYMFRRFEVRSAGAAEPLFGYLAPGHRAKLRPGCLAPLALGTQEWRCRISPLTCTQSLRTCPSCQAPCKAGKQMRMCFVSHTKAAVGMPWEERAREDIISWVSPHSPSQWGLLPPFHMTVNNVTLNNFKGRASSTLSSPCPFQDNLHRFGSSGNLCWALFLSRRCVASRWCSGSLSSGLRRGCAGMLCCAPCWVVTRRGRMSISLFFCFSPNGNSHLKDRRTSSILEWWRQEVLSSHTLSKGRIETTVLMAWQGNGFVLGLVGL